MEYFCSWLEKLLHYKFRIIKDSCKSLILNSSYNFMFTQEIMTWVEDVHILCIAIYGSCGCLTALSIVPMFRMSSAHQSCQRPAWSRWFGEAEKCSAYPLLCWNVTLCILWIWEGRGSALPHNLFSSMPSPFSSGNGFKLQPRQQYVPAAIKSLRC